MKNSELYMKAVHLFVLLKRERLTYDEHCVEFAQRRNVQLKIFALLSDHYLQVKETHEFELA